MKFRRRLRPFFRLGIEIVPQDPKRFTLALGIITFEIHSMHYQPGWWDVDFYIDTWLGSWGASREFGDYASEPATAEKE